MNDQPVSAEAEEIIKDITAVGFPAGILDDLNPVPHRLSSEDIAFRVRSARRRKSPERQREAIQEVLSEIEIFRLGFDSGYEQAVADCDTPDDRTDVPLDRIREQIQEIIAALDEEIAARKAAEQ